MTDRMDSSETDTKRLVVSIIDFLRDQLSVRSDFEQEDRDCLQIAIECLETAFDLESNRRLLYGSSRPLIDIYNQVTNPVSVKDKLRAEYHKEEGNNYMRQRMFDSAETEYTNAISFDKWNAIYYANRASARIEQRNYYEAIADCRQALELNPDYAKAHSRMGQAYALLDRPREAARCFRHALQLEPDNEKYRNNLRVAENQINTHGAAELITTLLSSFFGIGARNSDQNISRMIPTSFLIISESHPPIPERSNETDDRTPINEGSEIPRRSSENFNNTLANDSPVTPFNSINNISFPDPFGVIDEGNEEQYLQPFSAPTINAQDGELVIDIPFISFDVVSAQSSQSDSSLQNTERINGRYTDNLQNADQKLHNINAEKDEVKENHHTLFDDSSKEFGNGQSNPISSQSINYRPSGPEYIYHPSINNNEKEFQKYKNISPTQKGNRPCSKNNVNLETVHSEERNERDQKENFPVHDDVD